MIYQGNIEDLKNVSGIYRIICIITNKIYIGSSYNLYKRYNEHLNDLERHDHSSKKLFNAWKKYGKDNFLFEIVEKCEKENLISREQYYLDLFKPYERNMGYNNLANACSTKGFKHSKESKLKRKKSTEKYLKEFEILSPNGKLYQVKGLSDFAKIHGLSKSCLSDLLKGKIRFTKNGWRLPNTELPKYVIVDSYGKQFNILFGKLSEFCRNNNLHRQCISNVLSKHVKQYKGWHLPNN